MSTLTSSYSNAYSAIVFNRTSTSDRASVGNVDQTSDVQKTKRILTSDEAAVLGKTNVPQTTFVPQTESGSKSTDQQEQKPAYPEKSTDAGKPRSAFGDILDLSQNSLKEPIEQKDSVSISSKELREENQNLNGLTTEEQAQVEKLKARDAEVRNHEAAHLAAAGQYAKGGAKYEYQLGPDGKKYAIGGSVSIDSGPVQGDPEATIRKAQQIRAAALAPAEPSGQDQNVAAAASQMEADARLQLSRERAEEIAEKSDGGESIKMNSDKAPQKEENDGVFKANSSTNTKAMESKTAFKSAWEYGQELAEESIKKSDAKDQSLSNIAIQYLINQLTFEAQSSTFVAYA